MHSICCASASAIAAGGTSQYCSTRCLQARQLPAAPPASEWPRCCQTCLLCTACNPAFMRPATRTHARTPTRPTVLGPPYDCKIAQARRLDLLDRRSAMPKHQAPRGWRVRHWILDWDRAPDVLTPQPPRCCSCALQQCKGRSRTPIITRMPSRPCLPRAGVVNKHSPVPANTWYP